MKEPLSEIMTFYGPGCCPKCHCNLWVADAEITLMQVSSAGIPENEETTNKVTAYCPECGHKQIMIRWKGGYIPYDYFAYMMLLIEEEHEKEKRIAALNSKKLGDGFGENPLSL